MADKHPILITLRRSIRQEVQIQLNVELSRTTSNKDSVDTFLDDMTGKEIKSLPWKEFSVSPPEVITWKLLVNGGVKP